ncbi:antibiotic biosynthesis monooxygenase [Sorangium atrum]|uniref:Antibiotic biosynthesis monooxygenase n=1 Tax=Sorangium atrum TaxID=2995308 RepID=A0ABT5BRG0_9BACT|nr:antibiotic biosynthesis monooxygenase [Sorangium aterium]MDC0676135.1 antibiotic biosynthesis monooxygenase [Sorangium aterium]
MSQTIHVAITRRVQKEHAEAFERDLAEFARRSLDEPGALGVHLLRPAPGSGSMEYGILRSFASEADREAFYRTDLYKDWLAKVEPMVEGKPIYRELGGLEAWFPHPRGASPPRWKMALLTWIAVWPVSMAVPAALVPLLGERLPRALAAAVIAAGIVVTLTWAVMPLLVKLAAPWLNPTNGDP